MELLASKTDDVLGAVWLATALMTYDATRRESSPPSAPDVAFQQSDIVKLAGRIARGAVHGPRVSQWANGDHPDSSRNYLRAVGTQRRLASASDFEGERTLPWDLYPGEAPMARWTNPGETITFGALVEWVVMVYSDWALTFPGQSADLARAPRSAPSPKPAGAGPIVQAPREGFSLDSTFGKVDFVHAPLRFDGDTYQDAFSRLRPSITVRAVLAKPRYASLRADVERDHPDDLDRSLADFLAHRKRDGDAIYTRFLNEWGDRSYRRFWLTAPDVADRRGVYAFASDGVVKYIGRSRDPFRRRIEQGYGYIAPRACFLDGQSTNCKVNSLVTQAWPDVDYFVHVEDDEDRLMALEADLIARYSPEWNTRGR